MTRPSAKKKSSFPWSFAKKANASARTSVDDAAPNATKHASEENKKCCIDAGMNAVLTKPLLWEKAEDILNSFIPHRKDKLNSNKAKPSSDVAYS